MIRHGSWWLPDGETHLVKWMNATNHVIDGRQTYQYHKYEAAMKHTRQRRVSADCGAHVGLWSFWMARDFETVECFEPKAEHIVCWTANMIDRPNARMHPVALGAEAKSVGLVTGPSSSGDTAVDLDGIGVPMKTLDSYEFPVLDLLKLDMEGYEVFALEGARETLARCRPTVIVEQKPGHGQHFGRGERDAVTLLESMGAKQVWEYAGDFVLVFPEAK
jgi:FkbM family methyltransferase